MSLRKEIINHHPFDSIQDTVNDINERLDKLKLTLKDDRVNLVQDSTLIFSFPFDLKKIDSIQNLIFLTSKYSNNRDDLDIVFKEIYEVSLIKYSRDRKINKILDIKDKINND